MNFYPLADRVLLSRVQSSNVTAGGIVLPDNMVEPPPQCLVVATGPKVKDLKPNDLVLIGKWAGAKVKIDNEEFLILREEEIFGVLSSEGAAEEAAAA